MNWQDLLMILLPGLAAGLLIVSTHVPLGYQVLKRGIIFIDLAVAQLAAAGVILARILEADAWLPAGEHLFAGGVAMAGATLMIWLERRAREQLEALIGIIYVMGASGVLLLVSQDPHGAELIKHTLAGSLLWVTWSDLWSHALVYVLLLALMAWRPALIKGGWFYPLFAIAITSSVQLVGVFLVFASLILPALASYRIRHMGIRLMSAYLIGLFGFLLGLALSAWLDLPSGATVVWTLAFCALAGFGMIKQYE